MIFSVKCCAITVLLAVTMCTASPLDKAKQLERNPSLQYFSDDEIPVEDDGKAPTIFTGDITKSRIVSQTNSNHGKGKFKYALETQNGIEIEQVGKLKDDKKTLVVTGSFAFTGPNGKRYRTRYTADERGYHPITELEVDIPELGSISTPSKLGAGGIFGNNRPTAFGNNDQGGRGKGGNSNGGGSGNKFANRFGGDDDDNGNRKGNNNGNGGLFGNNKLNDFNNGKSSENRFGNGNGNGNNGNGNRNGNGNGNGNGNTANNGYDYGAPVKSVDRLYLPVKDYLPPKDQYLPPNDILPPIIEIN